MDELLVRKTTISETDRDRGHPPAPNKRKKEMEIKFEVKACQQKQQRRIHRTSNRLEHLII